jgi:hypothetical protein
MQKRADAWVTKLWQECELSRTVIDAAGKQLVVRDRATPLQLGASGGAFVVLIASAVWMRRKRRRAVL